MSTMLVNSRKTRVLGLTNTGLIIRSITGSEETDEERKKRESLERDGNNSNGNGSGDGGSNGSGGNGNGGENSGGSGDGTDGNGSQQDKYPGESEAEQWRRRADASDRKQGELQKELDKYKAANQSELERAQTAIAKHEQTISQLTEQRDNALIQAEILKFPGYEWQDPDVLLRLIDRDSIAIDESGGITGVKDSVKKAADAMPYLLKDGGGKKDDKTGGTKKEHDGSKGNEQASGGQPNNGKPDQKNERRQELSEKYNLGVF